MMECYSKSNAGEENNGEEVHNNSCNQNQRVRKSLIYLFIRYVWDERDGECCEDADTQLMNWLKSTEVELNVDYWHLSRKLDVRNRMKIEVTSDAHSDENFLKRIENSNDEIVYARLVYNLRKVLPALIICNDDVNFTDEDGQTFLHTFLEKYFKKNENFTADEIIRLQELVTSLINIEAPFYVNDTNGKTPLHIALAHKNKQILQVIASCLTDLAAHDKYGNTALHIIVDNCVDYEEAKHKDILLEMVRSLVLKGGDPNAKNSEGLTPVHLAAEKFNIDILQLFAENNADFNRCTSEDELPLHFASKSTIKLADTRKMIETVDFLIAKSRADAVSTKGYSPLHYAAESGNIEVVERLIESGAAVDCRTEELHLTPLHLALKANRLDHAKGLLRAGADINAEALDGSFPVFLAAMNKGIESLRYLVDQGADLTRREKHSGFSLLHFTAWDEATTEEEPKESKFNLIIKRDVLNVDDPGSCGVTPLMLATLSHNVDAVKMLVERGANVNYQRDYSELTALQIASLEKNLEIVKVLIEAGAEVNSRGGDDQMTPLHFAVTESLQWSLGKYPDWVTSGIRQQTFIEKLWPTAAKCSVKRSPEDIVAMLIAMGADVNAKDVRGRTSIHLAALTDSAEAVRKLLEMDSVTNIQDHEARLPLHNALKNNQIAAVAWLLAFGAEINEDDTIQLVLNSQDSVKKLVINHAIKLKCVDLPIATAYEALIGDPEFANFYEMCREEAKSLLDYYIANANFSLYEFLHMGWKRQNLLIPVLNSFYKKRPNVFRIYSKIIWGACFEAENRMAHLRLARVAWYEITNLHLPDVCVERIFSHLNNRTLEMLAASGEVLGKIIPTEEKQVVFQCQFGN